MPKPMRHWIATSIGSILANQPAINEFDRVPVQQDSYGNHLVILVDGEWHNRRSHVGHPASDLLFVVFRSAKERPFAERKATPRMAKSL
jgi:hypothetical protein